MTRGSSPSGLTRQCQQRACVAHHAAERKNHARRPTCRRGGPQSVRQSNAAIAARATVAAGHFHAATPNCSQRVSVALQAHGKPTKATAAIASHAACRKTGAIPFAGASAIRIRANQAKDDRFTLGLLAGVVKPDKTDPSGLARNRPRRYDPPPRHQTQSNLQPWSTSFDSPTLCREAAARWRCYLQPDWP